VFVLGFVGLVLFWGVGWGGGFVFWCGGGGGGGFFPGVCLAEVALKEGNQ